MVLHFTRCDKALIDSATWNQVMNQDMKVLLRLGTLRFYLNLRKAKRIN